MQTIGAFEAKTHFSSLLEKVEKGEQIVITKHGRPVAKLVPTNKYDTEHTRQVIEKIKEFGSRHTLNMDWKILRDKDRK